MKTRLVAILMVLILLSLACTSGSDKDSTLSVNESTSALQEEVPTEDLAEEDETSLVPAKPTDGAVEIPAEPTIIPTQAAQLVPFDDIVVVDNEEVTIKITGIDPDSFWGYEVNAYLENKSATKTYMFSVIDASINGIKSDPFFATEIAPGKKEISEISFTTTDLKENGVDLFTEIEIIFRVYDSDDWLAEDVAYETVNIYPYGQEKAGPFVREPKESDTVILDNELFTVIVTGYEDDAIWGFTANLYLVNKSDKEVMFSVSDASVNGFMVDPFYARSLLPGKVAFSSMSWSDTSLEEQGITEVEEIEFSLRIYDYNNFGNDLFNQVITLNP